MSNVIVVSETPVNVSCADLGEHSHIFEVLIHMLVLWLLCLLVKIMLLHWSIWTSEEMDRINRSLPEHYSWLVFEWTDVIW